MSDDGPGRSPKHSPTSATLAGLASPRSLGGPAAGVHWGSVLNLCNAITGVGVVTMPFVFDRCGLVLGALLVISMGRLSNYTMGLLTKAGAKTRQTSYESLVCHVLGPGWKRVAEASMMVYCYGIVIAFLVVEGDLLPAAMAAAGFETTESTRAGSMTAVAVGFVFPTSLLRDISVISRMSFLCLALYVLFCAYLFGCALQPLYEGGWLGHLKLFSPAGLGSSIPLLGVAFAAHTTVFIVYENMPRKSVAAVKHVIDTTVHLTTGFYLTVAFLGYVNFVEGGIPGNILLSLSSAVIKFGFACSILLSFPLAVYPCRSSLNSFLGYENSESPSASGMAAEPIPPQRFILLTTGIVFTALFWAIVLPDVETVMTLLGAVAGVMISYLLPTMVHHQLTRERAERGRAHIAVFLIGMLVCAGGIASLFNSEGGANTDAAVYPGAKRFMVAHGGKHKLHFGPEHAKHAKRVKRKTFGEFLLSESNASKQQLLEESLRAMRLEKRRPRVRRQHKEPAAPREVAVVRLSADAVDKLPEGRPGSGPAEQGLQEEKIPERALPERSAGEGREALQVPGAESPAAAAAAPLPDNNDRLTGLADSDVAGAGNDSADGVNGDAVGGHADGLGDAADRQQREQGDGHVGGASVKEPGEILQDEKLLEALHAKAMAELEEVKERERVAEALIEAIEEAQNESNVSKAAKKLDGREPPAAASHTPSATVRHADAG